MCKVYSLDTFRELVKQYNTNKEEAITQSVIKDQLSLETHLNNIDFIKQCKLQPNQVEIL